MSHLIGRTLLLMTLCLLAGCGGGVDKKYQPEQKLTRWSYDDWSYVLERVVDEHGFVKHDMIENNTDGVKDALLRYVGAVNVAGPNNRPELFPTDEEKLAYWINAYNALCMYAVMNRGFPSNVLYSRGIPGSIFLIDQYPVGKDGMSLDAIEKRKVRSVGDPRIHFALNCMSFSCPPLRAEPFEAGKLDQQLDEQGRIYLSDPRAGKMLDQETVGLNDIFTDFYKGDFIDAYRKKSGNDDAGLLESIKPFAGDNSPVKKASKLKSIGYDWSLNRPPATWPPGE